MKHVFPFLFAFFGWTLLSAADLQVRQKSTSLAFTVEGQTVCEYQMQPGALPEGVAKSFAHGAHLHPIYSPGGKLVTGNHQPDHPWQRGVWIGWTKTEFGDSHPDFWNTGKDGKIMAEVRFEKLDRFWDGAEAGFTSRHAFLNHQHLPDERVLNEIWDLRVSQKTLNGTLTNIIDLTSTQTCAGDKPLKLPKYHYGGLGLRGNPLWNPVSAVTMLTSEGHDRKSGDGTKARWVYLGGEVDGALTGISVLIHPSNFRFPQPLRLNPKNPQLCVAPSQDGEWSIEPGKPYVSQYRLLVFDGKPDANWLEDQWQSFAK